MRPSDPRDCGVLASILSFSLPRLTLLLFLTFQAADGLMTYGATTVFGIAAEGNPIIATWMQIFGVGPAVFGAKAASAAGGILLYWRGVHLWLAAVTAFYALAAVIPWLRLLSAGIS